MKNPDNETSVAAAIIFMLFGPILWAVHFLLVYGGQSSICAVRKSGVLVMPQHYASILVVAITIVISVAMVYAAFRPEQVARLLRFDADEKESQVFAQKIMRPLTLLSLFGVAGAGAAAFLIDACG